MNVPSLDDIRKFTILEDIHGTSVSEGRTFVCPYKALAGMTPAEAEEWVDGMVSEGLLHRDDDMNLKVTLTAEAREMLIEGTAKRYSPSVFRGVVRERLLKWVAEHSTGEDDYVEVEMDEQERWYYGREITVSDLESAAEHLKQHDLIDCKSTDDNHLPLISITESGRKHADHFDGAAEIF
jgi:hypothetical protein